MKIKKTSLILFMLFFATISAAQGKPDEAAIRNILQEEVAAWNKGDAHAYSQHFAADGTFTNVQGMFFTGHQAFLDRHEEIFKGMLRGTVLRQEVCFTQVRSPGHGCCGNTYLDFRVFSIGPAARHAYRCQGTPAHSAASGDGERRRGMEDRRVSQRGCEADGDNAGAPIGAPKSQISQLSDRLDNFRVARHPDSAHRKKL